MPIVFVQEFAIDGDDRSTANYDAINERLNADGAPPAGLIVHSAGFDEEAGVFRIFDVWETQEDNDRFLNERLGPIIHELMAANPDAPPPSRQGSYKAHHVIKG